MRRRYWVTTAIVMVVLVLGETVYWQIMTDRLRAGFQAWMASQVADGWNVGAGPIAIGGWPRAATVTVSDLVLRQDGAPSPERLSVAATKLTLSLSLLSPGILQMSLTGPTHVRSGSSVDVIAIGDQVSASMPLRQSGPQTGPLPIAFHANQLRLKDATGAWQVTAGLLSARAEITGEATPPVAIFTVSAEAIALPTNMKWPLGGHISSWSMDGRLNGPLPALHDIAHWAQEWRDGGGSLDITHFTMGWGPLGLTSSATLALDEQLQPMGSGNGRIIGYAETLDRLAAGGLLTKSGATAAKAVLSLLAGTTTTDEPNFVDVPLTLQYRTLSMRQVPLVRLPELDWPAR